MDLALHDRCRRGAVHPVAQLLHSLMLLLQRRHSQRVALIALLTHGGRRSQVILRERRARDQRARHVRVTPIEELVQLGKFRGLSAGSLMGGGYAWFLA